MKSFFYLFLATIFSFANTLSNAQIGMGGQPHPSAVLDLKSINNDKVFLPPRLTTAQRTAIINPPLGGMVFDVDKKTLLLYDGQSWISLTTATVAMSHDANKLIIPIGGNSWITSIGNITENISDAGVINWQNPQNVISTYVRVPQAGKLRVSVSVKVPDGESRISVNIAGRSISFTAKGNTSIDYFVDEWNIPSAGYVKIDLQALSKTGNYFGTVDNLSISGTSSTTKTSFVPNNNNNYFHFGRRGPSVNLSYVIPTQEDVEWYYNEITVPVSSDILGSYFMANGFAEGYFGMQVNSSTERRILFSVFSPSTQNDPTQVPDSQKIKLLKKGTGVITGEFGNEGTGGQSYLIYNWQAGNTYKFLVHGKPSVNNYTDYTAYFYAPEEGVWRLIASFSRPQTNTYLKSFYSFLENFNPESGNRTRTFSLYNQWVNTKSGQWFEVSRAKFAGDETANNGYRMDYSGGISNNKFYLRNCGFFDDFTQLNIDLSRPTTGIPPSINFATLP